MEQYKASSKKLIESIKDDGDYSRVDDLLNFIISFAIKLIIEEPEEIKDWDEIETMWGMTTIY